MVKLMDRDRKYYDLARYIADEFSKDPSTKVGAVLVGTDRRLVAFGYNGFPPAVRDLPERLADRDAKLKLTQHAERNVMDNARFPTEGATLYVTGFPCSECCKSVSSKGIRRVVCPAESSEPRMSREPWASDARWSRLILEESGVELVEVGPAG